jgi:catechol 2,3-dioxygenase-like lactoylglutathione lyase family enzyme
MVVQLNHTLVNARDKHESAAFVAEILGLEPPKRYGPFLVVEFDNGASLDFVDAEYVHPQHYAFLVSEPEFDQILGRIKARGVTFWADPFRKDEGEWNTDDGGRGIYWEDSNHHMLEIITRPYTVH